MNRHPTYRETATRSTWRGPRVIQVDDRDLVASPADGMQCILETSGDQPEVLVVMYVGGMGIGLGYTSPKALEEWAEVLRNAADQLRVKPAKPPEVS